MSDPYQPSQGQPGQPTQPPGQQPPESAPTEWIGSDQPPHDPDGAGPDSGGGGGRKRWVIPVIAVAAVLLIGGGAFGAYTVLSGGGPQPAEAIPDTALAYGRIDLDPSAEQKVNAIQLLQRVPQFEEETGITSDTDDLRRLLFEEALSEEEGCDLDYDDDVEPWLGERFGAAAMPPSEEGADPEPLLAIQVSDQDAAEEGIQALIDCGEATDTEDEPVGIDFVGDYALIADEALVEDYATEAEENPLSDDEGFVADMEALDGEGLVSGWLDLDALVDALGQESPEVTELLAALDVEALGSVSMAMRAQSDALELVYAGDSDALSLLNPSGSSTEPASDVPELPDTTMFAAGFTGGGETVDELWSKLLELEQSGAGGTDLAPGTLQSFADEVEAASGFVVPDDLSVLLGDQFTFAVDGEGFDFITDDGQPDFSGLNLGMLMRTDADAASDLVTRANDALAAQGAPFELAQEEVDGGLVVAANDDYAAALADGGSLGDTDAYQSAVADGDDAVSVVFLDFDRVSEVAGQVAEDAGQEIPAEASEVLDVLRAFGASTVVDDDHTRTTMRVVFD